MRLQLVAAVPLAALVVQGCSKITARAEGQAEPPIVRQVELTIYQDDFALVHEVRPLHLQMGSQKLQLTEVSKQLDPRSVMVDWAEPAGLPAPTSNSYDLGVSEGTDLMKRYLGKEIEIVRFNQNGSESDRQKGRLMVANGGQTVIQAGDKFLINPPGSIEAPTQTDIVTIPQLSVQTDSPSAQAAKLNVFYLTRGLSWSSDYVAELLPSDDAISLQCWATVTNKTGTSYPSANVTLMTGSPNRAALNARARTGTFNVGVTFGEGVNFRDGLVKAAMKAPMDGAMAGEAAMPRSVGDLQSYSVSKPADIVQDQMNRLMLLSSARVPIEKEYRAAMPGLSLYGYSYDYGAANSGRGVVTMAIHFQNAEKAGLGVPLPAGILRIYGQDQTGSKRYLGAADVWNAPKDAKVDVTLSNAFDLYTMRRVTGSKKINKRTVRKSVEITVFNSKSADADVTVVQPYYGKFKVVEESLKHKSPDAATATWKVHVPKGGKTVLKFSADVS